jgi:hypothetical protein
MRRNRPLRLEALEDRTAPTIVSTVGVLTAVSSATNAVTVQTAPTVSPTTSTTGPSLLTGVISPVGTPVTQ